MALATAVSVVLGGCGLLPRLTPTDDAPAPSTLEGFFDQDVDWQGCGAGAECAIVAAPLDWSDAGAGSIDLALSRVLAPAASRLGSILVNPGGPGGSGYDFVLGSATYATTDTLRERYDIVGWDPRGVGASSRVECLDDAAKDELLFGTWENDYDTEAWVAELAVAEAAFVEACVLNTGPLLEFVDSQSTAADMDLIRALLGEEQLNYLGFSYGTMFGAMYAELFPERVGRFVLDGALDPTLGGLEWLSVQMAGFDSAMLAYLDVCVAGPDCPFIGTVDDAAMQFQSVMDTVDDVALRSGDGRTLDSATLGTAIAQALYSESSWPSLTAMLTNLAAGEADAAFQFADLYYGRSGGTYASNSFEVYTATLCLDGDYATVAGTTQEGIAQIAEAAPLLGSEFSYDDYAHLDVACSLWPYPPKQRPASFDAEGANPIIVIGTTNDPATPYVWAQALAEQLSSGTLVTFDGEGHTAYPGAGPCIQATVDAYFVDGTVPAVDPDC